MERINVKNEKALLVGVIIPATRVSKYKSSKKLTLKKFDQYNVPVGEWHQITNPFKEKCHIIEIQYGEACVEDDIERVEYYKE